MTYRSLLVLFALLSSLCLAGCGTKLSAPTANIVVGLADGGSLAVGVPVGLDGSGSSDPNGEPLAYRWMLAKAPAQSHATISSEDAITTSFTPDVAGDYVVELLVSDGALTSPPATATVTAGPCGAAVPKVNSISGSPASPNAGDSVLVFADVADADLDAACDIGEHLDYLWSLVDLPAASRATLNDATSHAPTLFADEPGDYRVALVVTDRAGHSSGSVETTITVAGCSQVPPEVATLSVSDPTPNTDESVTLSVALIAHAPPQVPTGEGTPRSDAGVPSPDPGCTPRHMTNHWALISAPPRSTAALTSAVEDQPSFVPDLPGTYVVEYYVENDRGDWSNAATIVVTASVCGSRAPTLADIVATSTSPAIGQVVGLSTTVDDADSGGECGVKEHFTYAWRLTAAPAGSTAALNDAGLEAPSFLVDRQGTYAVELVVTDSEGHASDPKTLTVTSTGCGGNAPVVSKVTASPAAPNTGSTVTLSATATDADTASPCSLSDNSTLTWVLEAVPSGSRATISGAHETSPWFVADVPGKYTVQAWATDSTGRTSPGKTLDVTAAACGSAVPSVTSVAAAPAGAVVGSGVSLSAAVTDADTTGTCKLPESFSYLWALTAVPSGSVAVLTSASAPVSGFVPDKAGTYTVGLVVTDSEGHSSTRATTNISVANATTCGGNAPVPRLSAVTAGPCGTGPCSAITTTPSAGSAPNATPPGYVVRMNGHTSARLDASGSTDADNFAPCNLKQTLFYSWTILTAPVGSKASWTIGAGPTTTLAAPTFVPDVSGTYQVGLVVSDGTLASTELVVQVEL